MHPLLILLIGVVTVIGLILVLRLNAFLALIMAAILVSLLAPGAWPAKVARVGEAFGSVAGKIGIVIALAAIIGQCLMESGAADRIVRSLLRALGESRAAAALLAAGFVLSIPMFFDTVIFLLVPLARSLWRRTRKNYVLYITALAAGAAITHTLVPPTPGPLFVANELKVNLGMMIIMGLVVGAPTAVLGFFVCTVIGRRLDIPMRPIGSVPEPEPLPDERLPPLWISVAPVVLPVILISANTTVQALASGPAAAESAGRLPEWLSATTSIVGHPNMALLLAVVVGLVMLVRSRRPSLKGLARTTETALMSAGVILLITVGGGAFGAMLRESGVQGWVRGLLGEGTGSAGIVLLLSGFLASSFVKIAQGSSTVAMITATSLFTALGVSQEMLGCHPVYLALAIGCGSLVCSWMNDSGFWIIARMCGLTEVETLKSWTVAAASVGVLGLLVTLTLAMVMPLT
jgi:GntP family gluconate:H+ symporter